MTVLAAEETIDLLFTDFAMPGGMNGCKLAEAARYLRPNLRVLLTTGYAASLSNPGEQVLQKPYGRRELANAIRCALDGDGAKVAYR